MQMPETFMRLIRAMSLEDLKELRKWNSQDSGFNRHANQALDREINQREQVAVSLYEGVWCGKPIEA